MKVGWVIPLDHRKRSGTKSTFWLRLKKECPFQKFLCVCVDWVFPSQYFKQERKSIPHSPAANKTERLWTRGEIAYALPLDFE
jgi:hypothetical protein